MTYGIVISCVLLTRLFIPVVSSSIIRSALPPQQRISSYTLYVIFIYLKTQFFLFFHVNPQHVVEYIGCWSSVCPICGRHGNRMAVDGPQQTGVRFSLSGVYSIVQSKKKKKKENNNSDRVIHPSERGTGNGIRFSSEFLVNIYSIINI